MKYINTFFNEICWNLSYKIIIKSKFQRLTCIPKMQKEWLKLTENCKPNIFKNFEKKLDINNI